jgi:phosphopantetheinyl transferase (holo-ACP synthase)
MRNASSKYLFGMLILGVLPLSSLSASDPGNQQGMLDRIMHPDRTAKSSYQGKTFDPGRGYSAKPFMTKEYAGTKSFESKSFASKTFDGVKQSWMGRMLFHEKKLPENLQATNRDATKQFASKEAAVKNYADLNKKSSFADRENFSTREASDDIAKGKMQGGGDPHMKEELLKEAVKKGLSMEDVRKLLNKPL